MPDDTMISRITQILRELNQAGGFAACVLTGDHGLPLASAIEADQESQAQATVVALLDQAAGRVADRLGMAETDEIAVGDTRGRLFVSRRYAAAGKGFSLSVPVPNRMRRYRLLTNRTVHSLQRTPETLSA